VTPFALPSRILLPNSVLTEYQPDPELGTPKLEMKSRPIVPVQLPGFAALLCSPNHAVAPEPHQVCLTSIQNSTPVTFDPESAEAIEA
jgi:hypothetical protein